MVDVKACLQRTLRGGVLGTVVLLAALDSALGAATAHRMTEAEFRTAMGFAANQEILYRAADGSAIGYAEFGKQVQAGRTFEADKSTTGAVVLHLQTPTAPSSPPPLPDSLPALKFTTIDGQPLRSMDFADRPLLLSFFFSKCTPCIQEIPILNAFASKHSEYRYLAVTFDPRAEAQRFVQQFDLKWPVVADAQEFISGSGVVTYPAYLLVSAQGRIVARGAGLDARAAADPVLGLKVFEQWVAAAR